MTQETKKVLEIIYSARKIGYNVLLEHESKQILSLSRIPVNKTELVTTVEEAIAAAKNIKYPVVMKVVSHDMLSKTEVGGIKTGIGSEIEIRQVFESMMRSVRSAVPGIQILGVTVQEHLFPKHEAIIRAWKHERYGAVIMFGLKGVWTESLDDFTYRLAPLNEDEASEMINETKAYGLARGLRKQHPRELKSVARAIVEAGNLVEQIDEIEDVTIDPLFIMKETGESIAVDARITLRGGGKR